LTGFSADSKFLACRSQDSMVRIYDLGGCSTDSKDSKLLAFGS
jgi:hypothetical protein